MDQMIKKRMKMMLIGVGILFGIVFGVKAIQTFFRNRFFASMKNPVLTVSSGTVNSSIWNSHYDAVGSTRATLGVNVTAQLSGQITGIYFVPGAHVKKGDVLVQQNADPEIGQLHAYQATAELNRITYERDKKQYAVRAISKQQLDSDYQNWLSSKAQVEEQAATVAKYTITAPFDGKLGICPVYPGQFLSPGDTVVSLQALDPIYVDFYLPQQALADIRVGQEVSLTSDASKNIIFKGKITTVMPVVQTDTRNVQIEATIDNPNEALVPGMFVPVSVDLQDNKEFLTLQQSAITFNSYGDIVYIIENGTDEHNHSMLVAKQVLVTTGETRGEQIQILKGLKKGQQIVTSGQLKLKNGSFVAINNSVELPDNPTTNLPNDHQG